MNTNVNKGRLRLSAAKPAIPCTLGNFVDARVAFLKLLGEIHPLFKQGLHLLGNSRENSPELALDFSNVEAYVIQDTTKQCREYDARKFTNMSPGGEATRQTTSTLGFSLRLDNLCKHEQDNVLISLDGGSTNPDFGDGIGIALPYSAGPEFSEPAFLRKLLGVVVDYWKPDTASISNLEFDGVTRDRDREPFAWPVGWINYVDDFRAAGALPPDIHRERFGDGVLFTLEPDSPLKDFDAAAQKARRVRDALLPGHWMSLRSDRSTTQDHAPKAA